MEKEKYRFDFDEWKKDCPGLIVDGIVNVEAYSTAPIRILYFLKEANGGESWDLREYVAGGGRPQTWDNIARWTKGILENDREIPWTELKEISEQTRIDYLKYICVVNAKKTSGGHTANADEIFNAAVCNRERLKKQIDVYDPQLIICCGTERAFFQGVYEYDSRKWKSTSRGVWYMKEEGRVMISYAHPMTRVSDNILYYGIVDAVKEILATD